MYLLHHDLLLFPHSHCFHFGQRLASCHFERPSNHDTSSQESADKESSTEVICRDVDVIFAVEPDKHILVHSAVLAHVSEVFAALLGSQFKVA